MATFQIACLAVSVLGALGWLMVTMSQSHTKGYRWASIHAGKAVIILVGVCVLVLLSIEGV